MLNKKPKYVIEMKNITKYFDNFIANNNINLNVKRNEIHGLIGENGAGKSTLMSILFGLLKPTSGYILINGKEINLKSVVDAERIGIGMVHQHFKLVDIYNAVENIILGIEPINKIGFIKYNQAKKKLKNLVKEYNFDINLDLKVSKLSVSQRQKIEILKLLYRKINILIFDEPTAILSPHEINNFLNLLKFFKSKGKTIIIISHKLKEIKAICDSATVIRSGCFIKRINVKKTSIKVMSKLMVGKEIPKIINKLNTTSKLTVLSVKNLCVSQKEGVTQINNISFDVHAGEILAIAGVEGNGQKEIINLITGLSKFSKSFSGEIKLNNVILNNKKINERYELGLSHIPEDRKKYGLIGDFKLKNSLFIQEYNKHPFSKYGILINYEASKWANKIINGFDVRGANFGETLSKFLSGGNQQKGIVGREIFRKHSAIIIVQPTRGIDVGAINNIHKFILKEKQKKRAVLLVSYELSEVFALADRILVISKGQITGEVNPKKATYKEIGLLMAGKNIKFRESSRK